MIIALFLCFSLVTTVLFKGGPWRLDSPPSFQTRSLDQGCPLPPSVCRWPCPCVWQTWWGSPQSTPSPAESHQLCAGGPPAQKRDDDEQDASAGLSSTVLWWVWKNWAYFAQRDYTRDILYIEPHAIIRVIWQLDFLPSFVIRWYENFGNSVRKFITHTLSH